MSMILAFQSLPMHLVNEITSMLPWDGQIELHKKCMEDIDKYRKRLNYYRNKTKKSKIIHAKLNSFHKRMLIAYKPWKKLSFSDFVLKIPYIYSPLNDEWNLKRKEHIRKHGFDFLVLYSAIWAGKDLKELRFPTW